MTENDLAQLAEVLRRSEAKNGAADHERLCLEIIKEIFFRTEGVLRPEVNNAVRQLEAAGGSDEPRKFNGNEEQQDP